MTRKARAELRALEEENALPERIMRRCALYGFKMRRLYCSAVVITPISKWSLDDHLSEKTQLRQSSYSFNRPAGDPASARSIPQPKTDD